MRTARRWLLPAARPPQPGLLPTAGGEGELVLTAKVTKFWGSKFITETSRHYSSWNEICRSCKFEYVIFYTANGKAQFRNVKKHQKWSRWYSIIKWEHTHAIIYFSVVRILRSSKKRWYILWFLFQHFLFRENVAAIMIPSTAVNHATSPPKVEAKLAFCDWWWGGSLGRQIFTYENRKTDDLMRVVWAHVATCPRVRVWSGPKQGAAGGWRPAGDAARYRVCALLQICWVTMRAVAAHYYIKIPLPPGRIQRHRGRFL